MLLLCALVWGLAFAFQRSAANQINPIAFNGIRFCLASGVICADKSAHGGKIIFCLRNLRFALGLRAYK